MGTRPSLRGMVANTSQRVQHNGNEFGRQRQRTQPPPCPAAQSWNGGLGRVDPRSPNQRANGFHPRGRVHACLAVPSIHRGEQLCNPAVGLGSVTTSRRGSEAIRLAVSVGHRLDDSTSYGGVRRSGRTAWRRREPSLTRSVSFPHARTTARGWECLRRPPAHAVALQVLAIQGFTASSSSQPGTVPPRARRYSVKADVSGFGPGDASVRGGGLRPFRA
jgi:hypothetical protein